MTAPAPIAPLVLPDDIIDAVHAYANETAKQKRLLAHALCDYLDDLPHGYKMTAYEQIAAEWNRITGDGITGRTVRHWVKSVGIFSHHQLQEFNILTDAQLIEAVKLASDCQNITPHEICEWTVDRGIKTVSDMRAHWLPQTGTPEQADPPKLSALIRWFGRLIPDSHPKHGRVLEMIAEVRSWL